MMIKFTFHTLMLHTFELKEREVRPMIPDDSSGDDVSEFRVSGIVIPKIQRDYAQGRPGDAESVREDFVQSLYEALDRDADGSRCSLNFIYGQLRKTGSRTVSFVPLDGQQRLTTLFLLHWYLSRLEGRVAEVPYLACFRYDIRYSSAEFCTMFLRDVENLSLTDQDVEWLAAQGVWARSGEVVPAGWMARWLRNKPAFSDCWLEDPTIKGMLEMLETIHGRFRDSRTAGMLDKLLRTDLDSAPVYFFFNHVEPSADGGEMFIKMNSRGKLLTEYEYFKADFQRLMKKSNIPVSLRNDTAQKMDTKWEPFFWRLVSKHGESMGLDPADLDTQMMRYVNYAIDVLGFACRNKDSGGFVTPVIDASCKDGNRYHRKRLEQFLVGESQIIETARLDAFLSFMDAWTGDGDACADSVYKYFEDTFCLLENRDPDKISVFAKNTKPQMLLSVLSGGVRLTEEAAVLFFAATLARVHGVSKAAAELRLRTVRNLLCKMDRQEQDMPYVYDRVFRLMKEGTLDKTVTSDIGSKTFTVEQVREEVFKSRIASVNVRFLSDIRDLEESEWFKGSVAALLPNDYDLREDVAEMASTFAVRKEMFEKTFGALGVRIPDALLRDVLFWSRRNPYCVSARNSWCHWGTASGDFRWRGDDRPYFSRNERNVSDALLAILDGVLLSEIVNGSPHLRGEAVLEALRGKLKVEFDGGGLPAYDAAYYMSRYYDSFFALWNSKYKDNCARMKALDPCWRVVHLYHKNNRSNAYWDPYLYSMWMLSGVRSVSGIVNEGGTSGVAACFPEKNVTIEHSADRFLLQCGKERAEELKKQFGALTLGDVETESGTVTAALAIPRSQERPGCDAVDRIKMGSDLFKFVDSLAAAQRD